MGEYKFRSHWCVVGCTSTYGVIQLHCRLQTTLSAYTSHQDKPPISNSCSPEQYGGSETDAAIEPIKGNGTISSHPDSTPARCTTLQELFRRSSLQRRLRHQSARLWKQPEFSGRRGLYPICFTAPYTGGHFQPPAPGTHGIDSNYVFNTIDLLGGLLDFGVVGNGLPRHPGESPLEQFAVHAQ